MNVQPRVTCSPPTEVLLHGPMHCADVAGRQAEGDRQRDFAARMQYAGVVSKPHVLAVDRVADVVLVKQLSGLEHFLDEHGSLAVGRGR